MWSSMDLEVVARRISEILEADGILPYLESVDPRRGYHVNVTPWSVDVTCTEEDGRFWALIVGGRTQFGCSLSGDELTPTAHKVLAAVVAMMTPVAAGAVDNPVLDTVAEAARRHSTIDVVLRSVEGETSIEVEPYSVVKHRLYCWDVLGQRTIVIPVSSLVGAAPTGRHFDPRYDIEF